MLMNLFFKGRNCVFMRSAFTKGLNFRAYFFFTFIREKNEWL